MKKSNLLLAIWLLVTSSVFAQNSPSVWTHKANNGGNEIIIADSSQNVYVFDSGSQGAATPHVIKLNSNGIQSFSNGYLPVGYTSMTFHSALYYQGEIYFASMVSNSALYSRLCLTKISNTGSMINQVVIDSIAVSPLMNLKSSRYYSFGFSIDNSNNLLVSFSKSDSNFFQYFSFLKMDLNFNLLANFDQPLGYVTTAGQVAYQNDGSCYFSFTGSVAKLKSDYSGLAWTAPLADQYMFPLAISNDGSNNVYALSRDDANSTGTHLYRFIDGGNSYTPSYDIICCSNMAFDLTKLSNQSNTNCVYIAGFQNSSTSKNLHMKIEASTGNILWVDSVLGGQYVSDIFITAQGNLVSVGGGFDYLVWLYDSTGTVDKTLMYDGLCNFNDQIKSAVVLSPTTMAVTGYACENSNTIAWGTTLLYNIPTITTDVKAIATSSSFEIFPTPASSLLTINIKEEIKSFEVYSSIGQSFNVQMVSKNELNVSSLPSGIYFLRVTTVSGSFQRRFVIS